MRQCTSWRTRATAQQAKAALKTAEIALNRHISQTDADRERRITDAFAKATEQLENEKLSARLGAIYTLGRIADESLKDYWPTMETLAAFVSERRQPPSHEEIMRDDQPSRVPADVNAALHIIGRRSVEGIKAHESTDQRIDLSYLECYQATLRNCNFSFLNFSGSSFYQARFFDCIFFDTLFFNAFMNDVQFDRGTVFQECRFEDVKLKDADLTGVVFMETHLLGATLKNACVIAADFGTALSLTQEQLNSTFGDYTTILPPGLLVPTSWPASATRDDWNALLGTKPNSSRSV